METFNRDAGDKTGPPGASKWFLTPFQFQHPPAVATARNSPPPERSEPVPYLDPVPPGGGLGVGATDPSTGPIPLAQPLTFDGPHLRVFRAHLVRTGNVPLLRAPEYGSAPVGL